MIDYMVMYNSYLCDYYDNPKPYLRISEDFYPENPNDEVLISVPRRIDGINSVYPGANVTYKAGSEVHLMPGFHAYQCDFHAFIDPDLSCYPIYYEKTTTDPCGQRDVSIKKQTDDTVLDPFERSKTITNSSLNKSGIDINHHNLNEIIPSNIIEILDSNISIFPNPSSGIFYVSLPEKDKVKQIEVFNSYGVLILDCIPISNNFYNVDLSNRSSGIYYLRLVCNNSIYQHKLIKK